METKEPDSRLSVRKEDLNDQELYNLNKIINDLYSKITTARDETSDAVKKFTRSGVISSASDQSTASIPPPIDEGIPQPQASDWTLNPVVYSAGEDGLQYGFASASISNKPAVVDYYSMFIQDYSSGYVNTSGTAVTLTSASKEAGNTFENCVAGQVININSVAYTIASTPTSPYESLTLTTSAGTQSNVYFNLNPVDGKWEEIASDAEAGTWQPRPTTGWDVPCCLTASTKDQKTYEPPAGVNYKRLQFAAWGDAPQVTNFSVTIENQDPLTTDIPSGKFVVNFTKPLDPEYYYASIERLWYVSSSFTGNIGATAIVDVSGNTVTYNSTSSIYSSTFKGQYFNYIQPGDTVYISTGPTLSESNTYIVSEVISNTQLKLTTNPPAGTERVFAQWGRVAGEINPFTQNDYWPLPTSAEYWKFRSRSVNHRELANNTSIPTVNVTVPASGGITPLTPPTQLGSSAWSLNALQYSTDQAGNSSIFISAAITTPSANADYYSLFWQKTSGPPVSGAWQEIAADAVAGTWQDWPSAGATYIIAIAANKNTYKLDQPDTSVPSYYKSLVIPAWGDADQVTGFSVTVETDNRAGVPSGRFVFNFTKPADPDYYYAQISRIATDASYNPLPGATYGIVAGEIDPTKQTDWWPLPATAEYWKFKSESVNYRKVVNTASAPTSNVSVSTSSGITQIAPATITTAAFASTIRPVDLVTTAGIGVTSIVVASNTGTVTTASAHGLASGRQVAIYGGTGTSSKLNGLYTITVTGASTFTITTSGVANGTYSAGLNEVPLPSLPSATYPSGATAFVTANTKLYRSSGTAWTSAADGSDIVSNSITAGQIAAGAISTTELYAGEILVGGSSGTPDKPTKFTVKDSANNTIGFIGDNGAGFVGAYLINLRVGTNINSPTILASSSGVSINGATFSLAANGITTTIDNSTVSSYTAGLRIQNTAATKTIQLGLDGGNFASLKMNDTSVSSSLSAYVDSTRGGTVILTDLTGTSGTEIVGQEYVSGSWRGSITTGRVYSVRDITASGTITAGGSVGTSGQVLTSTGTGVQWSTAASSGWTVSGSDVYTLSSVGIGTSSPKQKLHVSGQGLFTSSTASYDPGDLAGPAVRIGYNTGGDYGYVVSNETGVASKRLLLGGSQIEFLISGAEKMRINSSGNVGIGTSSQTQRLEVYGSTSLPASSGTSQNGLFRLNSTATNVLDFGLSNSPPYGAWIQTGNVGSLAITYPLLINPNGGNVGIGTTSPAAPFHVLTSAPSAANEVARFQGGNTASNFRNYVSCYTTNPNYWWEFSNEDSVGTGSTNGFAFRERSAADPSLVRLYLASGGNVGIGTTSPDALLTVNTIASFGDGAETTPSIAHKGDLNTGFWFPAVDTVAVSTDGAERWRVTSAGFLIPADSDTYDIGILSTNRVRGVYAKYIETSQAGGVGDYVKSRLFRFVDTAGGSGYWDTFANASTIGSSNLSIKDNSGSRLMVGWRASSGSAVNYTYWYSDLIPALRSTAGGDAINDLFYPSLGSAAYPWGYTYTSQIYVYGTVNSDLIPFGTNTYDLGDTTYRWASLCSVGLNISGAMTANGSTGSSGQLLSTTGSLAQWVNISSQLTAGTGVTITGTTNATIAIGQAVSTSSNVTFNSATLANGSLNGIAIKDSGGSARTVFTLASDNNLYIDNISWYDIYLRPGSGRYVFTGGSYFLPSSNNSITCGNSTYAWSNVYSYGYYAHNGTSWSAGWTGTFSTGGQTVTVQDGIITNVV